MNILFLPPNHLVLEAAGLADTDVLRVVNFLERSYTSPRVAFKEIKQAMTYLQKQASMKTTMTQVHYLPITPQMRKEILTKGQPLWQFAPTAVGIGAGISAAADQQEPPS